MTTRLFLQSLFIVLLFMNAKAAPGDVDASFVDPNIVSTFTSGAVFAMARQTDGKIVIGGLFTGVSGTSRISLARLNADGSHDPTFTSPLVSATTQPQVNALAIQPDGKILVGGILETASGLTNIIRVNADGSPDVSFAPPGGSGAGEIVVQTDGKILVGTNQRIVRLNANGTLDLQFTVGLPFVRGLALQPDGKIVAAATDGTFNGVARYNANGTIDATFHSGTLVLTSGGINDVVLQTDGGILVGGSFTTIDAVSRPGITRLTANGSVDAAFNGGSMIGEITKISLQPDGKIVAGGFFRPPGVANNLGFARFNTDGAVDATFDVLTPARNTNNTVFSVIVQPDGKILLGGRFTTIGSFTKLVASAFIGRVLGSVPTASSVSVGGQILSNESGSIPFARVIITLPNGEKRAALTNSFGFYRFDGVPTGESHLFEVRHKYYQFVPQVVFVTQELSDLNFTSLP